MCGVLMRMKKILLILLSAILFIGCKTDYIGKYSDTNRFFSCEYRECFQNDSLLISMELAGDYTSNFDNNEISKKEFLFYKRIIKSNIPDIKIKRESFIYKASTTIEPWLHTALFVVPASNKTLPEFIVDTAHLSTLFLPKCSEKQYIRIFTLDNKKHGRDYIPYVLVEESNQLNETFQCDDNFKKLYPQNPFASLYEAFGDSANYLRSIRMAKHIETQYYTQQENEMWLQAALTYNSFISNNVNFKQLQSQFYRPNDNLISSVIYDDDVISYIQNQTKDKQLVMINEQHWYPKHRYLGNYMLKYFYDNGFRYLAVEAIWEDQDSLNMRRYPLQSTGFYLKEPQFGNFIRNALEMGFEVIGYDDFTKDREYEQAANIYTKTFKKDPHAKVLVWAGIGHINEEKSNVLKMGYYLKELSGIDPFTIEQVGGDVKAPFLNKHYLAVNSDSLQNYNQHDMYIYNNIPEASFKLKPEAAETNIPITLSPVVKDKIKQHGYILFMVYIKEEFENHRFKAIPILNYLIENKRKFSINLPSGEYMFIMRTPSEFILEQTSITVN